MGLEKKRITKISRVVDHLAVVLPFEKIFDAHMKNVHYVGHPLLENKELVLSTIDYNEKNLILEYFQEVENLN